MMLTYEEIMEALGKSIVIFPFDPDELRGSNYNLRVGEFVWLHPDPDETRDSDQIQILPLEGMRTESGRRFDIPSGGLVCVLTKEVVFVDNTIAGLFHSKVDMVTKGFSHISTTLDPGWIGPLIITIRNNSPKPLALWEGETFVKVTFFRLSRPTRHEHNNPPGRFDQLSRQHFRLPEGQGNFFELPSRCNIDALKRAFRATQFWRDRQEARAYISDRVIRWVQLVLSGLALAASVTSLWWFKPVFGVEPQDEALVGILAMALTAFYFFTRAIGDPPWRPVGR